MKNIPIATARNIAEACGAEAVVVLAFDGNQDVGTSYGKTEGKCAITSTWMDRLIGQMRDGWVEPPDFDDSSRWTARKTL